MKFRFRLIEELLDESAKTDFVDKFGQDRLNNFDKARQRMKNKDLSVDYQSYLKMAPEELDDFILSLYDKEKDIQKKRILQGKDREIRGKYNYLSRYGNYDVYEPLDYIASMDLGVNTGWCTAGRYRHAGHPEFTPSERDAEKHFNDYTSNGIRLIYLLNPQTMYGEYAIAIYPKKININGRMEGEDGIYSLKSTNFELFNAEDENIYDLDILPKQLIKNLNLQINIEPIISYENAIEVGEESIIGVDLLSIDEAKSLPTSIRAYSKWWWLRSPGVNSYRAAYVSSGGSVDDYGNDVRNDIHVVRPALKLNPDSLNLESLKVGSAIKVLDRYWAYIGNNKALLMSEPLTRMAFREDWKSPDANVYEKSDVKKFLDNWLKEQMS